MDTYRQAKFSGMEKIHQAQTEMLRKHLLYAAEHSPAYREMLRDSALDLASFKLSGLAKLPFTEKKDIERNPASFLAVDRARVADIALSSGTTGKPLQIFYTENDLKRLAYNEDQAFEGCGIGAGDTALLTCTMDRCFIAGLAYFLGMRSRGVTVIRNGHGVIESHAEMILNLKPTVIVGVPTFLRKLGLAMEKRGDRPGSAGVKKLVCIGEPLRGRDFELSAVGRDLERIWNARVFSTYASSETITTFCECSSQRGGHLIPELAVVEIIDEQGRVLPPGETGEIVLTPMSVEAMPLVRYKTGDISFLEESPCSCGRFSPRLGPILGRKNQLMKVKGTSLYPQAVFSALEEIPGILNYFVEVTNESELSDRLKVYISQEGAGLEREKIEELLAVKLRVKPEVVFEKEETVKGKIFTPQSRKPVRFFDLRKDYEPAK